MSRRFAILLTLAADAVVTLVLAAAIVAARDELGGAAEKLGMIGLLLVLSFGVAGRALSEWHE